MGSPLFACVRCGPDEPIAALIPACRRLTPRIERHPDALMLEVTGCERLVLPGVPPTAQRGAAANADISPELAAGLFHSLQAASPRPYASLCIGLAPTRTVAWLAARSPATGGPFVSWRALSPRQVVAFLRPLPLAALHAVPELAGQPETARMYDVLTHSGIRTLGQVARLSEATLRCRFGPAGTTLAALAAGRDIAPLQIDQLPVWLGVRVRCAPPAAAEHVARALPELAGQLAMLLARRQGAAGTVALILHTETGPLRQVVRRLHRPVATAGPLLGHARRLLQSLLAPEQSDTTERRANY